MSHFFSCTCACDEVDMNIRRNWTRQIKNLRFKTLKTNTEIILLI